ncbi:hypothetical protein SAMN05421749_10178 [Acinetobacter marinus]|uniref:Uncharacterized protein n=1 Tax=Acinetobacter marinus TaxID=281375 RepID=A0A1G6GJU6_9GAMM|nr:hypothetical protein [Acinetobacter marinus]SDB82268.1 hypothetical protein SAMN05421749_10178 [Acinetobacter marinus]
MGQRANYIVLDKNKITIHYNHWRANCIAKDLYLGEKIFLDFVNNCTIVDEIMENNWIEGCVIIDKDNKELSFWTLEYSREYSVIDYYLKQLVLKWKGWNINILKNRMYDVEKILDIDYMSKQKIYPINIPSTEQIISDHVNEWISTTIIIKENASLFVTRTGSIPYESILSYGQKVITLIQNKKSYELLKEGEDGTYESVLIDIDHKKVFINENNSDVLKSCKELWSDYEIVSSDFGYIEILRIAGLDTANLELSVHDVKTQFEEMVRQNNDFNPYEMADKIEQEYGNVQFSASFSDSAKPKTTALNKLISSLKRFFGKKNQ